MSYDSALYKSTLHYITLAVISFALHNEVLYRSTFVLHFYFKRNNNGFLQQTVGHIYFDTMN